MSAEEKMKRKSQAILEFLVNYGWAIFVVLVVVGTLAYFGILNSCILHPEGSDYFKKNCAIKEDVIIDSEPELLEICNRLVVNNEVYPFLEVMGNGLKKANGAEFVAYQFPSRLKSDLDIFNVDGLIFCGVPVELCYTENNDIRGGTYCLNWVLEVPVDFEQFSEWYRKVSEGQDGKIR